MYKHKTQRQLLEDFAEHTDSSPGARWTVESLQSHVEKQDWNVPIVDSNQTAEQGNYDLIIHNGNLYRVECFAFEDPLLKGPLPREYWHLPIYRLLSPTYQGVTQLKMFEGSAEENEEAANMWLRENPQVEVQRVDLHWLHDLYSGVAPQVCNQWLATVITYTEILTGGEDDGS
jgi:hypothetical protein